MNEVRVNDREVSEMIRRSLVTMIRHLVVYTGSYSWNSFKSNM